MVLVLMLYSDARGTFCSILGFSSSGHPVGSGTNVLVWFDLKVLEGLIDSCGVW